MKLTTSFEIYKKVKSHSKYNLKGSVLKQCVYTVKMLIVIHPIDFAKELLKDG